MNLFEKITHFLDADMTEPQPYGIFHIVSFVLVVLLTAFLVYKFKDASDKTFRIIVFSFWVAIVLFEVYKQINFSFSYNDGDPIWDYQWYAFPYQFCSTPLYVLPFIAFLKNGKVRDACISFMTYFSLVGGIVVFAYPGDVFIETIGINIQTMFHHGMQLVFGIYFTVYNRRKVNFKYFLSAVPVFTVLTLIAMLLNIVIHAYFMANGIDETFNMFFISPYYECTLPVFSNFYSILPYPIFLFLYILGMAMGSSAIFFVQEAILSICKATKSKERKNA